MLTTLYCSTCLCSTSFSETPAGEAVISCNNPRCLKVVALAVAHEALLSKDEVVQVYARIQMQLIEREV